MDFIKIDLIDLTTTRIKMKINKGATLLRGITTLETIIIMDMQRTDIIIDTTKEIRSKKRKKKMNKINREDSKRHPNYNIKINTSKNKEKKVSITKRQEDLEEIMDK